ncbi:MAG TPA: hypothetical protein PLL69_02410, partial [Gemmatimonadales bacterium]|nr:hypothetical protein [Gemmatimonadales bacterium]
ALLFISPCKEQIVTGITQIALAGLVMVGLPTAAIMSGPVQQPAPETTRAAEARFLNNTTGTATVSVDGTALWSNIETGQTSEWAEIRDSSHTFTMVSTSNEADTVRVTHDIESGARYTLTGKSSMDGKLELTIVKDEN